MNELLDKIKDEVAKENCYSDWTGATKYAYLPYLWPIVAERYAEHVARASVKASLKLASENAQIDYQSIGGQVVQMDIDKSSIDCEQNVVILKTNEKVF